jgi:hypothetical protein
VRPPGPMCRNRTKRRNDICAICAICAHTLGGSTNHLSASARRGDPRGRGDPREGELTWLDRDSPSQRGDRTDQAQAVCTEYTDKDLRALPAPWQLLREDHRLPRHRTDGGGDLGASGVCGGPRGHLDRPGAHVPGRDRLDLAPKHRPHPLVRLQRSFRHRWSGRARCWDTGAAGVDAHHCDDQNLAVYVKD